MKTFHSDLHRLHDVPVEFNRGEMVPAFERPSRADNVLASLQAAKLGPLEAPWNSRWSMPTRCRIARWSIS